MVLSSCVDKVTIPQEEAGVLTVNCEMLKGSSRITADIFTSDNLNGTQPIQHPEDAVIEIFTGNDAPYKFRYDENTEEYYIKNSAEVFRALKGREFIMRAELPNENFEPIEARSIVPSAVPIEKILSSDVERVTIEGKEYFERTLTVELSKPRTFPAFFHFQIKNQPRVYSVEDGDTTYVKLSMANHLTLVDVLSEGTGIEELKHREGYLIDHSRLRDNRIILRVRSPYHITETNQVFDDFTTKLYAVTKDYFQYHKAYSKIVSTDPQAYSEPVIWSTNIKGGFGHFSAVTLKKQDFILE